MNTDITFTDEELDYLIDTIGTMAAGALLTATETGNDKADVFLHERALRKLTEVLTDKKYKRHDR